MATILITGAATGIGKATAFALAKRGHTVIATAKTDADVAMLNRLVADAGVTLTTHRLDVTSEADRAQISAWAPEIVINNAAEGQSGPLSDVPLDVLRDVHELNVVSYIAVAQAAIPAMMERGSGRIINVSSMAGIFSVPFFGPYGMTKYAVEVASDDLRLELAPFGIKVSLIEPGAIATGFNERMIASKESWFGSKSLFWKDKPRIDRVDARLIRDQAPVEAVLPAMIHAVESKRPQVRYTAPAYLSILSSFMSLFPYHVQDRIKHRLYK